MLIVSSLIVGMAATTPVMACDLTQPENLEECEDPSMNPFEVMLDNVYAFAQASLQYLGFVAVFAGVTLWWGTSHNSDRAQIGVWLTIGGLMMIILYFGFSSIIELLSFIAE